MTLTTPMTTHAPSAPYGPMGGWGRERMGTASHGQARLLSPLRNFEFVSGGRGDGVGNVWAQPATTMPVFFFIPSRIVNP